MSYTGILVDYETSIEPVLREIESACKGIVPLSVTDDGLIIWDREKLIELQDTWKDIKTKLRTRGITHTGPLEVRKGPNDSLGFFISNDRFDMKIWAVDGMGVDGFIYIKKNKKPAAEVELRTAQVPKGTEDIIKFAPVVVSLIRTGSERAQTRYCIDYEMFASYEPDNELWEKELTVYDFETFVNIRRLQNLTYNELLGKFVQLEKIDSIQRKFWQEVEPSVIQKLQDIFLLCAVKARECLENKKYVVPVVNDSAMNFQKRVLGPWNRPEIHLDVKYIQPGLKVNVFSHVHFRREEEQYLMQKAGFQGDVDATVDDCTVRIFYAATLFKDPLENWQKARTDLSRKLSFPVTVSRSGGLYPVTSECQLYEPDDYLILFDDMGTAVARNKEEANVSIKNTVSGGDASINICYNNISGTGNINLVPFYVNVKFDDFKKVDEEVTDALKKICEFAITGRLNRVKNTASHKLGL